MKRLELKIGKENLTLQFDTWIGLKDFLQSFFKHSPVKKWDMTITLVKKT